MSTLNEALTGWYHVECTKFRKLREALNHAKLCFGCVCLYSYIPEKFKKGVPIFVTRGSGFMLKKVIQVRWELFFFNNVGKIPVSQHFLRGVINLDMTLNEYKSTYPSKEDRKYKVQQR